MTKEEINEIIDNLHPDHTVKMEVAITNVNAMRSGMSSMVKLVDKGVFLQSHDFRYEGGNRNWASGVDYKVHVGTNIVVLVAKFREHTIEFIIGHNPEINRSIEQGIDMLEQQIKKSIGEGGFNILQLHFCCRISGFWLIAILCVLEEIPETAIISSDTFVGTLDCREDYLTYKFIDFYRNYYEVTVPFREVSILPGPENVLKGENSGNSCGLPAITYDDVSLGGIYFTIQSLLDDKELYIVCVESSGVYGDREVIADSADALAYRIKHLFKERGSVSFSDLETLCSLKLHTINVIFSKAERGEHYAKMGHKEIQDKLLKNSQYKLASSPTLPKIKVINESALEDFGSCLSGNPTETEEISIEGLSAIKRIYTINE